MQINDIKNNTKLRIYNKYDTNAYFHINILSKYNFQIFCEPAMTTTRVKNFLFYLF